MIRTIGGLFGSAALIFMGRMASEPAPPPRPVVEPEPVVQVAPQLLAPTPAPGAMPGMPDPNAPRQGG